MNQILLNVGHTPIIEEFIPENEKHSTSHDEIAEKVSMSEAVFLFLTDNVVTTEYTKNWVIFEDGLARQSLKRTFVFERQGIPILYPIPYVTDYMIFDPRSINDLLAIQKIAKDLLGKFPQGLVGAGAGALLGAVFGPVGLAIGAIGGGLLGHAADTQTEAGTKVIVCPFENCHARFRYYSQNIPSFQCPSCRQQIALVG